MIMLLVLVAVGVGAFWAGKNSRADSSVEIARPPDEPPARREVGYAAAPLWPWIAGAAALGVLLLCSAVGPAGLFGPGLFAGLMGP